MLKLTHDFVYSPGVAYADGDPSPAYLTLRTRDSALDLGYYTWCALDGTPVLSGVTAKVMAQVNAELMLEAGFHL